MMPPSGSIMPTSVKAVALLLGFIGIRGITQVLGQFDEKLLVNVFRDSRPSELALSALRLLTIPIIILPAVGLWEGKPWA
jgi:hypothetical protein